MALSKISATSAYPANSLASVVVQTGDLIIVDYSFDTTGTATCSDNAAGGTNTYNTIGPQQSNAAASAVARGYTFYAIAKANATLTVTCSAQTDNGLSVTVYRGNDTTLASVSDGSNSSAEAAGATAHTSASVTPTSGNRLVHVLWFQEEGGDTTVENGAGFAQETEAGGQYHATYSKTVAADGVTAYTDVITSTNSNRYNNVISVFKEAGAAAAPVTGMRTMTSRHPGKSPGAGFASGRFITARLSTDLPAPFVQTENCEEQRFAPPRSRWLEQPAANLLVTTLAVAQPAPFIPTDWPQPRPQARVYAEAEASALVLVAAVAAPFLPASWPQPRALARATPDVTPSGMVPLLVPPFTTDIPDNPIRAPWREPPLLPNLLLTTLSTPFSPSSWPQPARAAPRGGDTWAAFLTLQVAAPAPFVPLAWDNPATAARRIVDVTGANLLPLSIIVAPAPFTPAIWPNPAPRAAQQPGQAGAPLTTFPAVAAPAPFIPGSWPQPGARATLQPAQVSSALLTALAVPFTSGQWPNPATPARQRDSAPPNLLGTTLSTPFRAGDWPNPLVPVRFTRAGPSSADLVLLEAVAVTPAPFRPTDWPNPVLTRSIAYALTNGAGVVPPSVEPTPTPTPTAASGQRANPNLDTRPHDASGSRPSGGYSARWTNGNSSRPRGGGTGRR